MPRSIEKRGIACLGEKHREEWNNDGIENDGRKNRGACRQRERRTRCREETSVVQADLSAARLKSCGWRRDLQFSSLPFPPHCWRNVLRTRNEITARKRDSPRLPSGQIRISSGDKPARDSVHRSWTSRISYLLATRRNHGADAFVDDSPSERQFERERSLPMDRGRRTFGRRLETNRSYPAIRFSRKRCITISNKLR